MTNKTRQFLSGPISGVRRPHHFATFDPFYDPGVYCIESEETSNNYRLPGGRWSGGGAWFLNRNVETQKPPNSYVNALNYIGETRMGSELTGIPEINLGTPSQASLLADGTTAIARTEPTSPHIDLSVTLGEMRSEGLPRLPGLLAKETTKRARNRAGGEYLNVEFGWAPLVRDIRGFAHVVDNHDKLIRQYQESANKPIKRKYEFPTVNQSAYNPSGFGAVLPGGGNYLGGGRYQFVEQRKWFEAEYIYYLPIGQSQTDKIRRFGSYARKLYGVRLTPEVLWNLSPWSWAADWFGNVGDVMHNVSALGTDGMVMRYGYIMCHTRRLAVDHGVNDANGVMTAKTRITESKIRLPATPFGFGVSYSGLSQKQIAIVAALGLSRW